MFTWYHPVIIHTNHHGPFRWCSDGLLVTSPTARPRHGEGWTCQTVSTPGRQASWADIYLMIIPHYSAQTASSDAEIVTLQRIDIPRYQCQIRILLTKISVICLNQQHTFFRPIKACFILFILIDVADNQNLVTTLITSAQPPLSDRVSVFSCDWCNSSPPPVWWRQIKGQIQFPPILLVVLSCWADLGHSSSLGPQLWWLNQAAGPGYLCREQVIISSSLTSLASLLLIKHPAQCNVGPSTKLVTQSSLPRYGRWEIDAVMSSVTPCNIVVCSLNTVRTNHYEGVHLPVWS